MTDQIKHFSHAQMGNKIKDPELIQLVLFTALDWQDFMQTWKTCTINQTAAPKRGREKAKDEQRIHISHLWNHTSSVYLILHLS